MSTKVLIEVDARARGDRAAGPGDGRGDGATGADGPRRGRLRRLRSRRSSRKAVTCKARCSARRWPDGSRPPKKRGAAPRLRLRPEEGKPRAERAPTDERGRRGRLHASLLEMHLRRATARTRPTHCWASRAGATPRRCRSIVAGWRRRRRSPPASERLHEMLGADLCPETVRTMVEGHGREMARFQAEDAASAKAFREAAGEVEFTTDAGKVNTREEGWKDLKIAVISKRKAGAADGAGPLAVAALAGGDHRAGVRDDRHGEGVSPAVAAAAAPAGGDVSGRRACPGRRRRLDLEGGAAVADRLRADARLLHACQHLSQVRRAHLRRRGGRSPRRVSTGPRPVDSARAGPGSASGWASCWRSPTSRSGSAAARRRTACSVTSRSTRRG